jgi:hypothetical protein
MKSEAAKGILRIISNYARLGGNLVLSVILVRFMLQWVRNDAESLVLLLGAGSGVAAMFREITDRAVVRELAAAYHADDSNLFRNVFNSSLAVSTCAAGVVVLCFFGLFIAVRFHFLDVKPSLLNAAYVMIVTQAVVTGFGTAASPLFNMQVVSERFTLYNFWTLADRASLLGAALLVRYGMGVTGEDPARAVILWTITATVLELLAIAAPMLVLMRQDPRLRPLPALATRKSAGAVFSTLRWYVGVELAGNLYDRAGFIFSNVFVGRRGNLVYGLGQQAVNYTSQMAGGISLGLDAISARLESKSGRSLPVLLYHSTRLLGLAAVPVGVAFFVLAPQLIRVWVGKTIEDPEENIPRIAITLQIMAPMVTLRAISLGWTTILYGAGHLRRYAPLLLTGGICNVVLTTAALLLARSLGAPELVKQYLIPSIIAVVNGAVVALFLPRITARCLGVHYRDLFIPLIRPAIATCLCLPVLLAAPRALERLGLAWNVLTLLGVGAVFGGLYVLASALIVLAPEERKRFIWAPLRRVLGRGA